MCEERIEAYIRQRMEQLEKGKDLQEVVYKGRFSFGIDEPTYGKLPGWKDLVQQKKRLVRTTWINAAFLALMVTAIAGDFIEKFSENWLKALLSLVFVSALIMLFYIVSAFHNQFFEFRKTERLVRKLIYQDILAELKKEEKEIA